MKLTKLAPLFFLLCSAAVVPAYAQTPTSPFHVIDFDFPGGKLSSLLDHLSAISKHHLNVILIDGAGDIVEPAMTLRQVEALDVLDALCKTSQSTEAYGRWEFTGNKANPTFTVRLTGPLRQTATTVAYIGGILKRVSMEDLAAAIAFAVNDPDQTSGGKVRLRLHKETSLLIIEGSNHSVEIAKEVIFELSHAPEHST